MKLKQLGSNQTELTNGRIEILFSYETPVAFCDTETGKCYKTSKKWSTTTSRHINSWLQGRKATPLEQKVIEDLLEHEYPKIKEREPIASYLISKDQPIEEINRKYMAGEL